MHPTLGVLVFDDETFVRKRLRKLLSTASNIRLVGEMTELSQLLTHCLALQPQVVLIGSGLKPFIFDLAAAIH